MGLNVCKRIVSFFGGDLRVDSEYGKGSTFTFTVIVNEFSNYNDMEDDNNNSMINRTHSLEFENCYTIKKSQESSRKI